ncbi:hypothetical protein evm_003264 [Chilo suppressalis]|nr:hypothetical protein evm_003264 [Chilo suppressalis]
MALATVPIYRKLAKNKAITNETTTRLLLNDILNILLCVAQLLPSVCSNGSDLAGLDVKRQTRDVRDLHAKCNELFKCFVYRGADLHFIHQAFKDQEQTATQSKEGPNPWFTFVSPHLFDSSFEVLLPSVRSSQDLPNKTAIGLELIVLLAQPQPSWNLLVKDLTQQWRHLVRQKTMALIDIHRNVSSR